jgi:hypothetical protein
MIKKFPRAPRSPIIKMYVKQSAVNIGFGVNINPKITRTKGGYQTDEERDSAMTKDSMFDIAFVADNKVMSGTAENILRRFLL